MTMPLSSAPRGLVTPIEPASARLARASVALPPCGARDQLQHRVRPDRGRGRIVVRQPAPSQRGRAQRARPSDAAVRRRRRRRRRRDGARPRAASSSPTCTAALDGARPDAERVRRAMLGADRAIASRIAQVTTSPGRGDGGAVRADQRAGVEVADRLGRRLPRLSLVEPRRAALRAADARRHLPPARRGAARRRLARRPGAHGRQRRHHRRQRRDARPRLAARCSPCAATACTSTSTPSDWRRALTQPVPLARRCDDLIALASANGSTDDATVLLVQRIGFASARPHWLPPFPRRRALRGAGDDAGRHRPGVRPRPAAHGHRRPCRGVPRGVAAGRAAALHQALPGDAGGRLPPMDRARVADPGAPGRPRHRSGARRRPVRPRRRRPAGAGADLRRRRHRRPLDHAAAGAARRRDAARTCSRTAPTGGPWRGTA